MLPDHCPISTWFIFLQNLFFNWHFGRIESDSTHLQQLEPKSIADAVEPANIYAMDTRQATVSGMQDVVRGIEAYSYALESMTDEEAANRQRLDLLTKARKLVSALETPLEAVVWMAWAEPTRLLAIRIAIDLDLFGLLSTESKPLTHVELAQATKADVNLMGRILKHLATMSIIEETNVNTYKSTALSEALTVPKYRDAIPFCAEAAGPVFQKMPSFLANTGYSDPTDPTNGPFQFGHDTTLRSFMWRKERPRIQTAFNNHMAGYHQGRPSWMDRGFYPIEERILPGIKADPSAVAIVDVGGSLGHDLRELKKKWPSIPGRFVLQDLPQVIEQVKDLTSIEATVHDFNTAQPVKGARMYYMHSVLHDWPDDECKRILGHIVAAMEPGYSRVLINENVVPDLGASWQITSLDWFMMALAAARERTESQWRDLLQGVGLKINGIWTKDSAVESLIEAVPMHDTGI